MSVHLTQTDVYLEELTDVVPETDNTTQTDAFLERPPTLKFVPAKSGVDAETQIEEGRSHQCRTHQGCKACSLGPITSLVKMTCQHMHCTKHHVWLVLPGSSAATPLS
jgi:hypothetical protein